MYTHRLTQHCKAVILQLNIHTYIHTYVCMYVCIRAEKHPRLLEKGTTKLN